MKRQRQDHEVGIPAKVRFDRTIPPASKLLYAEIMQQAAATGYCVLTNEELGVSINRSATRITALLSVLVSKGYIERIVIRSPKTNEVLCRKLIPLIGR